MPVPKGSRRPIRHVTGCGYGGHIPRIGRYGTRPTWLARLDCGHTTVLQTEPGARAYCPHCPKKEA